MDPTLVMKRKDPTENPFIDSECPSPETLSVPVETQDSTKRSSVRETIPRPGLGEGPESLGGPTDGSHPAYWVENGKHEETGEWCLGKCGVNR